MSLKRQLNPMQLGTFIVFTVLLVFILAAFISMDRFWNNSSGTRLKAAESAIQKAAIQCYALEGSYPPSLEYLEKNYGIILNKSRYFYHYTIFASNIMPEIGVYEKNKRGVAVEVQ